MDRRNFIGSTMAACVWLAGGLKPTVAASVGEGKRPFSVTALNPDCMVGGAGLCVVIRTPAGKTYLFDTGNGDFRYQKQKNNGKDIVIPWLKAHGITEIDGLIITHYHADHFGGFLYLRNHFPIKKVFNNSFEPGKFNRQHDIDELNCAKQALKEWEKDHPGMLVENTRRGTDLGWNEPGVEFEVVWPPQDHYCEAITDYNKSSTTDFPFHHLLNANSTAIRAKVGDKIFFIGGDNSSRQYLEKYMLPYYEKCGTWGADAIVLPGHGDPTIWDYIKEMMPHPEVAVGSLGNLPWMMASGRQVLANHIDKGGIRRTYCTNIHGDVTFSLVDGEIRVSCDAEKLYVHDPR